MILLKDKPDRSEQYKKWVRTLACHVCCVPGPSHAHHENPVGQGTMAGKTSDSRCLPMCLGCHQKRHTIGRRVWGNGDPEIIIEAYRLLFIKQGGQQFWRGDE